MTSDPIVQILIKAAARSRALWRARERAGTADSEVRNVLRRDLQQRDCLSENITVGSSEATQAPEVSGDV